MRLPSALRHAALAVVLLGLAPAAFAAADRGKLSAFVAVTGYDVVIDSLQQGAMAGPGMVGDAPATFGRQYTELAEKIFDPAEMNARALDILAAVMPDALVDAGADFYASDLGQRLVAVENAAHMADGKTKFAEGQTIVADLVAHDPDRLELLKAMSGAIGSEETGRKAIVEIQLRFMLAAMAAGAMPQGPSEDELRALLDGQARANAARTEMFEMISNAYTYRDISDADVAAYVAALKTPELRQVYEILNATQYQVMIERYEALGARLGGLKPQKDL
jgi:Uncharacterized protein conserved in bacteria (DUF2059)